MLTLLLRLLLFISALWLVRALLAAVWRGWSGSRRAGQGGVSGGAESRKMVKDPVCGMYMDPRLALRIEDGQGTYFFCSEACRAKFLEGAR